jgi:hypothetical protein
MDEKPSNGPVTSVAPDRRNPGATDPLAVIADEIATYRARLPELIEHEGQFVLIKGTEVVGLFDDESDAIREGRRRFGLAPFLVKRITDVEPVIYFPNVVI